MLATSVCAQKKQIGIYRRRDLKKTDLYQVVQEHLESWLQEVDYREGCTKSVPRYIEREFRSYLKCGILAHGFARARCSGCGYDFIVGFSCKVRGACPSCMTRRMVETGMHCVTNVLPLVPVRQFVLSVPKNVRYHLKHDHAVLNRVLKIFIEEIERCLMGVCEIDQSGDKNYQLGGMTFIQRFGSSLNHPIYI